ncbi:MAG TPA: zf-TFIIB domain-containing protein [Patescibacteria group bacterium]|nr:zf-TFIIB domain-containing protein [Patescibacteria group bacterium]
MTAFLCPSCGAGLDPDSRACPHCRATVATRRCAVCFDLNLIDDKNCRRCGARLPEENPAARPDRLACPGCGSSMTPRRLANSAFDECDACGGLWLSVGTATGVATEAETRAQLRAFDLPLAPREAALAASTIEYRPCPVCLKMMNRSQYAHGSGVVVDLCRDHGTYYDRGELTRIFTFIESGGLEKARRRESESLKQEIREARRQAISAREGSDLSMESPVDFSSRFGALDLVRWLADYLVRKRSANSG